MKKTIVTVMLMFLLFQPIAIVNAGTIDNLTEELLKLDQEELEVLQNVFKGLIEKESRKNVAPRVGGFPKLDAAYKDLITERYGYMQILLNDSYKDIVDGEAFVDAGLSNPMGCVAHARGKTYFVDSINNHLTHRTDSYLRTIDNDGNVETIGKLVDLIPEAYGQIIGLVQIQGELYLGMDSNIYTYDFNRKEFKVFDEKIGLEWLGTSNKGLGTLMSTNAVDKLYVTLTNSGYLSAWMFEYTGKIMEIDVNTKEVRVLGQLNIGISTPFVHPSTDTKEFYYFDTTKNLLVWRKGGIADELFKEEPDQGIRNCLSYNNTLIATVGSGLVYFNEDRAMVEWLGDSKYHPNMVRLPESFKPFKEGRGDKVGLVWNGISEWTIGDDGAIYAVFGSYYGTSIIRLIPPSSVL